MSRYNYWCWFSPFGKIALPNYLYFSSRVVHLNHTDSSLHYYSQSTRFNMLISDNHVLSKLICIVYLYMFLQKKKDSPCRISIAIDFLSSHFYYFNDEHNASVALWDGEKGTLLFIKHNVFLQCLTKVWRSALTTTVLITIRRKRRGGVQHSARFMIYHL